MEIWQGGCLSLPCVSRPLLMKPHPRWALAFEYCECFGSKKLCESGRLTNLRRLSIQCMDISDANKRFVRRGWWFEGKGLIIPCHSVCRQSLQLRTWITSATHCKRSGKRCCLSSRVPLTGYAYRLGLQPDTCMCMTCQPEWLILRAGC